VTDRGLINVDIQMRTNVPHIFAIGDIVGQPMLARKAVHEAHVAAEVAHGSCTDLPPVLQSRAFGYLEMVPYLA
jgi:dihydrolipoamide dehydrogenase